MLAISNNARPLSHTSSKQALNRATTPQRARPVSRVAAIRYASSTERGSAIYTIVYNSFRLSVDTELAQRDRSCAKSLHQSG